MTDTKQKRGRITNLQDEDEGRDKYDPSESPSDIGEQSAGGSAPKVTSDDDVDDMVEEVTGQEPKIGQTFSDMVNEAERARHFGNPDEDNEEEKEE